jgi:hypothetical protein
MLNTKSSLKDGWRNILKKKKKWQSLKLNGKLTLTVSLRSLPKLQVITTFGITWCGTNNAERGDQWMVSQNNEQLGVFTV